MNKETIEQLTAFAVLREQAKLKCLNCGHINEKNWTICKKCSMIRTYKSAG